MMEWNFLIEELRVDVNTPSLVLRNNEGV